MARIRPRLEFEPGFKISHFVRITENEHQKLFQAQNITKIISSTLQLENKGREMDKSNCERIREKFKKRTMVGIFLTKERKG